MTETTDPKIYTALGRIESKQDMTLMLLEQHRRELRELEDAHVKHKEATRASIGKIERRQNYYAGAIAAGTAILVFFKTSILKALGV